MESEIRQRKNFKGVFRATEDRTRLDMNSAQQNQVLLPNHVGFGILFVILLFFRFFYLYENTLPPQLKIKDANLYPERFIGERAELLLKTLTALGPRVVGSYENEILSVDFLKRELLLISQKANKIHKIELDIQKPTGSYFLFLRPFGFRNYYANIQNIVVKLSSSNATKSVLMNCHYDTVPESPGASDNGLNCVVMLEILRVLSSSNVPLKNNLILLFNGAEENPLQASHGFLSHKWSKEVKVVINLDSAGSGGKEVLFQTTGELWLIEAYAKSVPRPCGGVQAEELFQFGIIPSDTDFRVFRDFGNYSGLDLAHCFNGYVYHTKYDKMEFINPGVYQFTGDNMLALTKELVQSSELAESQEKIKTIYFDVFQIFLIYYNQKVSYILNSVTVVLSFWSIFKAFKSFPGSSHSLLKSFGLSSGSSLLAQLISAAVIFIISKSLDLLEATMSWYLRQWLILPLYGFPIVISTGFTLLSMQLFWEKDCPGRRVIHFLEGSKFFHTMLLMIGTLFGILTSFILMLIILPMSVGSLVILSLRKKTSEKCYLTIQMACFLFPLLYLIYQSIRVLTVIIPMTARMGPQTNSEFIIGALTFITSSMFLCYIVPFLLLLRKPKVFLISLSTLHFLTLFGVIFTNYGFPYDGNTQDPALQRFYIFHCERTFYDFNQNVRRQDSGFFVQSLDRNNLKYISEIIPELKTANRIAEDCKNELYCGFPVFTSRFIRPAAHSVWIDAVPPVIYQSTSLEIINETEISQNFRRIRILVSGPDHITIVLSPLENVRLVKWTFDEFDPKESQSWNNRPTYMVYYSHGLIGGTLEFDVDLEVNKIEKKPVLEVAIIGHYMHDGKIRREEFKRFLSRFPDWSHLTTWTTTYKSWTL